MPEHQTESAYVLGDLWHYAYCRWYDADRAGRRVRAATWGRIADQICHRLTTTTTTGVNGGQGTNFLPDGADDAPDESKGAAPHPSASRPAPVVHLQEHECVFVEEREPSGRLILPPCIVCGLTALDALEQLSNPPGMTNTEEGA